MIVPLLLAFILNTTGNYKPLLNYRFNFRAMRIGDGKKKLIQIIGKYSFTYGCAANSCYGLLSFLYTSYPFTQFKAEKYWFQRRGQIKDDCFTLTKINDEEISSVTLILFFLSTFQTRLIIQSKNREKLDLVN